MRLIDSDALQKLFNEVSTLLLKDTQISKDAEHAVRAFITLVEPNSGCGFAMLRCEKCGEMILDGDYQVVSHADGADFYTWTYRHKCGGEFTVKIWR